MLQVIAMITMFLDHLGVVLGEKFYLLRLVGRVSMPIYAYLIYNSFRFFYNRGITGQYIKRLVFIGCCAQIAFISLVGGFVINICFVWALSVLWLYLHESKNNIALVLYSCCIALIFGCFGSYFDYYGIWAFVWVILFYIGRENWGFLFFCGLLISLWNLSQLAAVLAVPIIYLCDKHNCIRLNNKTFKYVWRWFYPVHMYLLRGFFYAH